MELIKMAMRIWTGTVMMMRRKMKRRMMRRRSRIRMRMMAKNLGRLARERWEIHRLTMLIPW
jgi:hypothetical protein